jgi:hypothetical protein
MTETAEEVFEEKSDSVNEPADTESRISFRSLPPEVTGELCSMFGCSPDALDQLLSAIRGDPDRVLPLLSALAPAFVAVKVRFETRRQNEFAGAVCIIAKGMSGEVIDETIWVGSTSLPGTFSVESSWESVRNTIQEMTSALERVSYKRVQEPVRKVFSPTAINSLYRSDENIAEMAAEFSSTLTSLFHYDLTVEIHIERFNKTRLDLGGLGEPEKKSSPEEVTVPEDAVLPVGEVRIVCLPALDPVKGRAVSDLRPNDVVIVDLQGSGLASILRRTLTRNGTATAFPVLTIEKLQSGQCAVTLAISEGIRGIFKSSPDLRVKLAPAANPFSSEDGRVPLMVKMLAATAVAGIVFLFTYFFFLG